MHRDNRFRLFSHGSFQPRGIDIAGSLIGLDRNRHGTHQRNRQPRRDIGIGRNNNFVTSCNPVSAQNQLQCIQPIPYTNAVRSIAIFGKLGFEGTHLRTKNKLARMHDTLKRIRQLIYQFDMLRSQVKERETHGLTAARKVA